MSLPELETLGRLGLPLLVVIYDDAAYGAEVHHFAPMGEAVDLAQFPDTDFAGLARAAGCHGLTARSLDDLGALREWLAAPDRPFVLDAKVDPGDLRRLARGSLQTLTEEDGPMPLLTDLVDALRSGSARVVDLTQPLSERTPVLLLPEPFANTPGLQPPRAQPLRRSRPGMGVGRPGDRRARRHALRCAHPLDHGPRRRGRRRRATRAARRPRRRDRQVRRGRTGPRLPADRRSGARLRGRARRDPRRRLAAAAHGLGRARPRPGRLPQRERRPAAHARHRRRVRALAGAGEPGRRASAWRPWEPTRAPPAASTRPSRSTTSCSAPASTASRSWPTWPSCRPSGAVIVVAPLKLVGGTGSPARVLALV